MEYVGEIVSSKEILKRMSDRDGKHLYVMQLKAGTFLDASRKGSISRFINHSCEPNCTIDIWTVAGQLRVGIFTLCDITADSELSFDYQWALSLNRTPTPCNCGKPTCRGFIEVVSKEESEMLKQEHSDMVSILSSCHHAITSHHFPLEKEDIIKKRSLETKSRSTSHHAVVIIID